MRRLGVVGLVSLDRVDGGIPRLGGAPVYAARALRLLGSPAVVATKVADEDRARLSVMGVPVVARPAERTIGFRIENHGDSRHMEIDQLGDPFTPDDVSSWLSRALADADWVHAGPLTREDFPAETLAALSRAHVISFDGQGLVRRPEVGELTLDADYDPEVLEHVDVLKLAHDELEALGLELRGRASALARRPRDRGHARADRRGRLRRRLRRARAHHPARGHRPDGGGRLVDDRVPGLPASQALARSQPHGSRTAP